MFLKHFLPKRKLFEVFFSIGCFLFTGYIIFIQFQKYLDNRDSTVVFRKHFVRIYDGDSKEAKELASLTGTGLETSIFTSSGSAITIRFQSDGSGQRSGFSLEYSAGMFDIEIKQINAI